MKSQFCVNAFVVLLTIDDDDDGAAMTVDDDGDVIVVDGNNGDVVNDVFGRIDCGLLAFDVLENDIDDNGNC